jgi:hypothetical protein
MSSDTLDWTWLGAWMKYEKGDPNPMVSLLLGDVPITESMRELLADLTMRGRIKPDPQESKANVTLLVAAIHFRALDALRREEKRSHDQDSPKSSLRRRPKHSACPSLRRWTVPRFFWLVVDEPIPEETRRILKDMSRDDLVDLVAGTYGVSEESLHNLLACRGRLDRQVRPYLLSFKPSV